MPATESLTIEILGDSSGLSQALDDALSRVESLQSAADSAADAAGGIGGRLATVSTALQPLQQVSQQLSRISQQASALAQQPISLNVQPALSALQSLMAAIQAVAAQLQAISMPGPGMIPNGPGGYGGGSSPGNSPHTSPSSGASSAPFLASPPSMTTPAMASPTPHLIANSAAFSMAEVGLVPSSISHGMTDPSQLPIRPLAPDPQNAHSSSGSVDARGLPRLSSFGSTANSLEQSSTLDNSSSTVNHFGGITIEVRETADVNSLMRDLRLQGLATRHRQG